MDRGKRKLNQRAQVKDECKKENKASSASNPTFTNAHCGSPQIPVSKTRKLSPEQESYHSSGAKPKISGGSEQAKQTSDSLHIYTVSSVEGKIGTSGKKIQLRVNHFPMKISVPGGVIYHYDVNFLFKDKKEVKKSDRKLLLEAIQRLKDKCSKIFHHAVVFDGFKNVYACKKLDFSSDEFQRDVEIKENLAYLMVPEVKVILKFKRHLNVNSAVAEYCRRGKTEAKPKDAIQALNIVLNMKPRLDYETFGLNHFDPNPRNGTSIDIGGGTSLWIGTFTSVRLGWKPMLNVDVANKAGCDESSVIEFIKKVLKSNGGYHQSHILLDDKSHLNTVDDKIKDLRIYYSRPNGYKRNCRVNKMMPAANKLKVKLDSGEEYTIEKYFKNKYKYQLKFPNYPCIHVGKRDDKIYLPIELCRMKKQFLPLSKCLDDNQSHRMIKEAAKVPKERRETIERNLTNLSNHYECDPYANDFGLKVSGEMAKVVGRVLDPPALKFENVNEFRKVKYGKWQA